MSFTRDRWTVPLDVRRVHPTENANAVAVEQIAGLVSRLPADGVPPLVVFDAGYDSVRVTQGLAKLSVAVLVRLRADRCFYADPPPAVPSPKGGRPRQHGAKFACQDSATWPAPTAEHTVTDEQYGTVRVRAWSGRHPKQQAHPGRGTRKTRPIVRGTVVLVEVSRLPARAYPPQLLWLWWAGPGVPDLDVLWRADVRRFDLEHTLRFCKQSLGWTTPRLRHPEQADRWTWLVVAAYTQLRLARLWVADRRLPWERHLDPEKLTPSRVRRAVSGWRADRRHASQRAKTVWPVTGPTARDPLGTRSPLPAPEESRLRRGFWPDLTRYAAAAERGAISAAVKSQGLLKNLGAASPARPLRLCWARKTGMIVRAAADAEEHRLDLDGTAAMASATS